MYSCKGREDSIEPTYPVTALSYKFENITDFVVLKYKCIIIGVYAVKITNTAFHLKI